MMPEERPDTPTFWRLSDLVRSLDAKAVIGTEDAMWKALEEVGADAPSVEYVASQRMLRMFQHMGIDPMKDQALAVSVMSAITVAWMEGFIAGRRFEEPQ